MTDRYTSKSYPIGWSATAERCDRGVAVTLSVAASGQSLTVYMDRVQAKAFAESVLKASARRAFVPECYDFDGDVTSEALQDIQTRANVVLDAEKWVTIEGYVGDRKK